VRGERIERLLGIEAARQGPAIKAPTIEVPVQKKERASAAAPLDLYQGTPDGIRVRLHPE